MPDFANPFSGNVPRPMSDQELIRAIRIAVAAEEEAVHMYTAQAEAAQNALAKKVLLDIADEERVHAGELLELLRRLAPDEARLLDEGKQEVEDMAQETG
ncbi:MAG: rubrerythrin [Armatimonadota bacterium]|nr:MAG: rubrerythrin [Armatimonadota bacterium]